MDERLLRNIQNMQKQDKMSFAFKISSAIMLKNSTYESIKETVDSFLNKMAGGKFSLNNSTKINDADSFLYLLHFIPVLRNNDQIEIIDTFIIICEESLFNCSLLCSRGLIEIIINFIKQKDLYELDNIVTTKLIHLIGILGGFRIYPKEIKALLNLMREEEKREIKPNEKKNGNGFILNHTYSPYILEELVKMTRKNSPSSFFNLDGSKSTGFTILKKNDLHTIPVGKKPYIFPKNGFSFSTWIRIEKAKNGPTRLFSILDSKNVGCDLYLERNKIVIQTNKSHSKKSHAFNYFFHTGRWYHITITYFKESHLLSFLSTGKVVFYVNGVCKQSAEFYLPSFGEITFGHFGTGDKSPTGQRFSPFCGQFSSIAFFDIVLTHDQIKKIFDSGPDFSYNFGEENRLNNNIAMLYHPRVCGKKVLRDNSFTKFFQCKVRKGTSVLISNTIRECIYCIGGIEVIYPLFFALKEKWTLEFSMCARIITLMGQLMRNEMTKEEIVKQKSFRSLAIILERISLKHIDSNTIKALFGLIEPCKLRDPVLKELYMYIFFNFRLWIRTPFELQLELFDFLLTKAGKFPNYFKIIVPIQKLLDSLSIYYYYHEIPNVSFVLKTSKRPNLHELKGLRSKIRELIKRFVSKGIKKKDVKVMLSYLINSEDDESKLEILLLFFELIDEETKNIVEFLSSEFFYKPYLSLLKNSSKKIKIRLLKVLGAMICKNPSFRIPNKKATFYMVIANSLKGKPINLDLYNTLIEILLMKVSLKVHQKMDYQMFTKIENINIMKPLLILLSHPQLSKNEEYDSVKDKGIRDLNILIKTNQENRLLILKIEHWDLFILQLISPHVNHPQQMHDVVIPLVIESIVLLLQEELDKKDLWKQFSSVISNIYSLSDHSAINSEFILLTFFRLFMPILVRRIQKMNLYLDNPFWINSFKILNYFSIFMHHDKLNSFDKLKKDRVFITETILLAFDNILKRSMVEEKYMKLLHTTKFAKKNNLSIKRTLKQIKNMFQIKTMEPTYFKILFELLLFCLENSSDGTYKSKKMQTKMLCLLILDIQKQEIPDKAVQALEMSFKEINQRGLYVICSILPLIETNRRVIPIIKALLRKYKDDVLHYLPSSNLIGKKLTYLEESSPSGDFLLRFKLDWMDILVTDPFKSLIAEINKQKIENLKDFDKLIEKKQKKLNKSILSLNKSLKTSDFEKTARDMKEKIIFDGIKRISDLMFSKKYSFQKTASLWDIKYEEMNSENGVYHLENQESYKYYMLDTTETENRMRPRLVFNKKGSSYLENSYFAKDEAKAKAKLKEKEIEEKKLASSILEDLDKEGEDESNGTGLDDINDEIEEEWEKIPPSEAIGTQEGQRHKSNKAEKKLLLKKCERILPFERIGGNIEITNFSVYFTKIEEKDKKGNVQINMITKKEKKPGDLQSNVKELNAFISFNKIKRIMKRRFLFQHTALEIFLHTNTTIMLNFESVEDLDEVIKIIKNQKPSRMEPFLFGSPSALLKRKDYTQKWVQGEISNFDYLMHLNTFSSRSYNDISQYPVFPWILNDYESENLDLNDHSIFRDLSKPIGAINEKNLAIVQERFSMFCDSNIPKFHFGSHYSSVSVPIYYMIRLEPFCRYNIHLQGGHFDVCDRCFNSVGETFQNTQTQLSDVKELIPEFFYFPEFLKNSLKLKLGIRQDKIELDNVVLPKWAKNSPSEFIRIHREALESDYVSDNLNNWIDLIFGYKQSGKPAEESTNVFYYLTYERAVQKALKVLKDPVMKQSLETQIQNFGQTPIQLFKKPHPKRIIKKKKFSKPFYWGVKTTTPFKEIFVSNNSIVYLKYIKESNSLIVVDGVRKIKTISNLVNKNNLKEYSSVCGSYFANDKIHSIYIFEVSKNAQFIIGSGYFDKSIKLIQLSDKMPVVQSVFHHDIVNCIKLSRNEKYLVSGSSDCCVNVWQIQSFDVDPQNKKKTDRIQYIRTLYGHENKIISIDVNEAFDTVVSGDDAGCCKVFSLITGKFIRTIHHPNKNSIDILLIKKDDAKIIMYSKKDSHLFVFSINGTLLAKLFIPQMLSSLIITENNNFLIGGSTRLVIISLSDMQFYQFKPLKKHITSISMRNDNEIVVGCRGGLVKMYGIRGIDTEKSVTKVFNIKKNN